MLSTGTLSNATTYTLNAKLTDMAGNVGTASGNFTVTVDTLVLAPSLSLASTGAVQPVLSGTGEAGATVEITDTPSGGSAKVLGTALVKGDSSWSFQATDITSGVHSITVKQTDVAGNVSGASNASSYTVDTNQLGLPALDAVVTSDSGTLGDGITNVTAPTFKGVGATANAYVDIYDNGSKIGQTQADGSGNWSFRPANSLSTGSHSIVAKELTAANAR